MTIIISDHHHMITTIFKAHSARLRLIFHRNYKNFNALAFLPELPEFSSNDPNQNHDCSTKTFLNLVDKYAPLKKKFIREILCFL